LVDSSHPARKLPGIVAFPDQAVFVLTLPGRFITASCFFHRQRCTLGTGEATAAGVILARVVALTKEVLKTMLLTKLKVTMAGLLLAGLLVSGLLIAGLGALPESSLAQQPVSQHAQTQAKPQPTPKPAGPGTLLLVREGDLIALNPDGQQGDELPAPNETSSGRGQCAKRASCGAG
jgi:hypothetical protein